MAYDPRFKESIILSLDQLPMQLYEAAQDIYALRKEIIKSQCANDGIRLDVERRVMYDSEKEEFKKQLSNKEKRDFEVTQRLGQEKEYQQNLSSIKFNQELIDKRQLEFEYKDRQFKAARAMAMLLAPEMLER